ncbi:MAG: hypothetical protein QXG00_06560 [Candidatus Woesearchaeota archaeon]
MITQEVYKQFNDIAWRLECHPAIPMVVGNFNQHLWYSLQGVCKHGYTEWVKKEGVAVWYNEKNYKKYKKLFDKEMKKYTDEELEKEKRLIRIYVPYKEMFGEPWKFDHAEYWGELSFYVYNKTDVKSRDKAFDRKNWCAYEGVNASGNSFEELIINIGKKFLKTFGNKIYDDYLTKEEKLNHKKQSPFLFNKKTPDGKGFYMDNNPKYIYVTEAEINRRWLQDFIKTDYCKKHWYYNIDRWIDENR